MKIKIIALIMLLLPFAINGQTINDAKDAYNKGAKVYASDKDSALVYFEQSLGICKVVGKDGDSLRMKIETYLPGIYYDLASAAFKEKKYEDALSKGQKALEIAETYKDEKNKQKATVLLTKANFAMGNNSLRAKDYDNAIKYYETSLKLDAKNKNAWFSLGQAYSIKGDAEKMQAAMDKTFEIAKAENDTNTVKIATKQCRDFYYKQGVSAYGKNDNGNAIANINKALNFDSKYTDAYWVLGNIYLKQSKNKEVLEVCNTALKYETNPAATVKLWFEMGYAYVNLKQNGEACKIFNKVVDSKDKDLAPKAADILKKNPVLCEPAAK